MKFGIISDLHFHNWSAFATYDETGLNSRLAVLMMEVERAAENVAARSGKTLVISGDVFHVRGSVSPSVLNPVRDLLQSVVSRYGLDIYILAGNHDIEGKHSTRLGSAVTALEGPGIFTVSESWQAFQLGRSRVMMLPWIESVSELQEILTSEAKYHDVVIMHAPINGVIKGIPDTGLDPEWIATNVNRPVFSGHYHNHKEFPGQVYSVGAIAHHTWGDVGARAGFMLVNVSDPGNVTAEFIESKAPKFVDLDPSMDVPQMAEAARGNYVRARVTTSDLKELNNMRTLLVSAGALGVTLIPEAQSKGGSRAATNVKQGMTLAESVAAFIDAGTFSNKGAVKAKATSILSDMENV